MQNNMSCVILYINLQGVTQMKWSHEADAALKKVPFFIRKKVRLRVEAEARRAGKHRVGIADIRRSQKRYLEGMADEIVGYQLETCFGSGGCPNRAREKCC